MPKFIAINFALRPLYPNSAEYLLSFEQDYIAQIRI
jgi:hypothetical protein